MDISGTDILYISGEDVAAIYDKRNGRLLHCGKYDSVINKILDILGVEETYDAHDDFLLGTDDRYGAAKTLAEIDAYRTQRERTSASNQAEIQRKIDELTALLNPKA